MLSPIPRRILRSKATFTVPGAFDRYQNPVEPTVYTVSNVHLQADNSTHKTAQNTEVTLRGVLLSTRDIPRRSSTMRPCKRPRKPRAEL